MSLESKSHNKIWVKHIRNDGLFPWADWIRNGSKTYEGRLLKGDWELVKIGDHIIFTNPEIRPILCQVIGMTYAINFDELYKKCGDKLIPNIRGYDAIGIYSEVLNMSFEELDRYHVVGVEIKMIQSL